MSNYLPILLLALFACLFSGTFILLSRFFGPHNPTKEKKEIFECGVPTQGKFMGKFSVKFYWVVVLFLLFDLEVLFLVPWAIQKKTLPWGFWLVEGLFFTSTLVVGWFYVMEKKVLEWGTPNTSRSFEAVHVDSE